MQMKTVRHALTLEKMQIQKKPKRTRIKYTPFQMELVFAATHYLDVSTTERLSRQLNIRANRIQVRVKFTDQNFIICINLYHSMSLLSSFRHGFKTNEHVCVKLEVLVNIDRNFFNFKCYLLPLLSTKLVHILVRIQVPILVFILPPVFLPILLTTLLSTQLPTRLPIHQPIKLPTKVYFLFNHIYVILLCSLAT